MELIIMSTSFRPNFWLNKTIYISIINIIKIRIRLVKISIIIKLIIIVIKTLIIINKKASNKQKAIKYRHKGI